MDAALSQLLDLPNLGLKRADVLPIPPARTPMPALPPGQLHEWHLATDLPEGGGGRGGNGGGNWYPPLTPMAALARQQIFAKGGDLTCSYPARTPMSKLDAQVKKPPTCMAWIGRRCWPSFQLLLALGISLKECLFLDPLTDTERFWAIGQTLACPAVSAVIADAGGMSYLASRRLQLAAEMGGGRRHNPALAFLARPPWETAEPSCAATRWEVQPHKSSQDSHPEFSMRLLSCRRQQREQDAASFFLGHWTYQVARGTGTFNLSPALEHHPGLSAGRLDTGNGGGGAYRDRSAQARALPA